MDDRELPETEFSSRENNEKLNRHLNGNHQTTRNTILSNLKTSADARHANSFDSSDSTTTRSVSSGIRLTGDPQTDEDIMAFMRARQELMDKSKYAW